MENDGIIWNDELNNRRLDLIEKDMNNSLTPIEEAELERLQLQMLEHKRIDKTHE
jgi:hypothetical protein